MNAEQPGQRTTATSCSLPTRSRATGCRAVVEKSKRAYAEARAVEVLEPSPERIPPLRGASRARRGRCCRTSASSRPSTPRSTTRCAGSAASTGSSSSRSCRPSSRGDTATSSSTRSGPTPDGRLVCGFHAPGRWEEIVEIDRLPARVRGWERGAGAGGRVVPRAGSDRLRSSYRGGLLAQPRGPREPARRRAPGPSGDEPGADRPRGPGPGGRAGRRAAVDPARQRRRDHPGRRDRADRRQRPARGGDRRDAGADLAERVLPDQHRDGRAALPARDRVRRAGRPPIASTTCTAGSARSGC